MNSPDIPSQPRSRGPRQHGKLLDWDIPFYEGILDRSPNHVDVLQVLGHLYTEKGETEKGLEADRRLVILRPTDQVAHYNLACSHALMGHVADALNALEQAVMLGFGDADKVAADPDLESLHEEPRFKATLETLKASDLGSQED